MASPLTIALANSGRKWIGEIAHVAMLYEQLEQLGQRPWIVCRRASALHERALQAGWRCLDLTFGKTLNPLDGSRDLLRWLEWARRERPDVIHCHRGKDHWLGCAVAKALRCPLVRTRHVVMPVQHNPMNRWLYLHATDAVLCVSMAVRAGFGSWAGRLPRGRVLLSAVDGERFDPAHRSEAWRRRIDPKPRAGPGERLWFGLVGRLQRIKGHHVFIEAAGLVAAARPEARFLLAGTGTRRQASSYKAQARELGFADRLVLFGHLDNLPEVLASLDVGVIASLGSEGSSRVALEMMASGLPLASTRVGGIPDLTESAAAARLVPPGDPAALAGAMLAWAADPAARRVTGHAARAWVLAHHDPRRWAESILTGYREILE